MFRSVVNPRYTTLCRYRQSLGARLVSSHSTSTQPQTNPPLPNIQHRKSKVELRPGPLKQKKLSPSINPKPISFPHASAFTKNISVKETTQRDIEDAESHGVLIPPPSDANWFKRTLHKAIQLAKFYFRGVKLVYSRRKQISLIRNRIREGGSPLTRWENRLIRTQQADINKIIPFLIIALLLEEVIPLIAIYAPFMLPSTCILPSQRARIDEKRREKAIAVASAYRYIFSELKSKENPSGQLSFDALRISDAPSAVCGLLGLSTVGLDALRIRRIRRHLEFITADDRLLRQDKIELSDNDLNDALQERGITTVGLSIKDKQKHLIQWLDSVSNTPTNSKDAVARRLLLLISRHSG